MIMMMPDMITRNKRVVRQDCPRHLVRDYLHYEEHHHNNAQLKSSKTPYITGSIPR